MCEAVQARDYGVWLWSVYAVPGESVSAVDGPDAVRVVEASGVVFCDVDV